MPKVAVVIRQLEGHKPTTHAVFGVGPHDNVEHDLVEHFLEEKANQSIRLFKEQFVEFKNAEFIVELVESQ